MECKPPTLFPFFLHTGRNISSQHDHCLPSDQVMTKRTSFAGGDFRLEGTMFALAAHPELVLHDGSTRHDACWELGVAVRAGR